jgi:hypothetical protein
MARATCVRRNDLLIPASWMRFDNSKTASVKQHEAGVGSVCFFLYNTLVALVQIRGPIGSLSGFDGRLNTRKIAREASRQRIQDSYITCTMRMKLKEKALLRTHLKLT